MSRSHSGGPQIGNFSSRDSDQAALPETHDFSMGIGPGIMGLGNARHSWVEVSKPGSIVTYERTGNGKVEINSQSEINKTRGINDKDGKITSPSDANSKLYEFENRVEKLGNFFKEFEALLPNYDPRDANCNGFSKFLIEAAGGSAELPKYAISITPIGLAPIRTLTQEKTDKYWNNPKINVKEVVNLVKTGNDAGLKKYSEELREKK